MLPLPHDGDTPRCGLQYCHEITKNSSIPPLMKTLAIDPKRNQTNVVISTGDLGVCLPKAAQKPGGSAMPPTPLFPQPENKGLGRTGVKSWICPEKDSCRVFCTQLPSNCVQALSRVPLPVGKIGVPAQVGSVRLPGSLPSLPSHEAPHPGQRLLLLGAQVSDSAAHGASGRLALPLMVLMGSWFCLAGQMFVPPRWGRASLTPPCPTGLSSPLGLLPKPVAKTHPTWGKEVTHSLPEHRFQLGAITPPPIQASSSQGLLQVLHSSECGRHKGRLGKFQGTPRSPSSKMERQPAE